ncbi:MAG: hypothetical protein GQ527_05310 [Bacteroidales bacterium]|nr:hypothetical protein [Bacteroidales bacterium]
MNYKVIISDSAKADIKGAAQWYHRQQNGLAKHFTHSIKECVKIIQLQPESFQIRYKKSRAGIPYKFPYLIIYNIDKTKKTVSIIAVFHSSQNLEKWKTKI